MASREFLEVGVFTRFRFSGALNVLLKIVGLEGGHPFDCHTFGFWCLVVLLSCILVISMCAVMQGFAVTPLGRKTEMVVAAGVSNGGAHE